MTRQTMVSGSGRSASVALSFCSGWNIAPITDT